MRSDQKLSIGACTMEFSGKFNIKFICNSF